MGLEEIEKLKERLARDPSSKLFVPLAEEYRQAGMYDEAIEVLLKGLERHPNYTSARVVLGKIYLERGDVEKAKEEFERVVQIVPDNLFAQKKLAEIYRDTGNMEKALYHYEKVLELNPSDEDARRVVDELKPGEEEPVEDLFEAEDFMEEPVEAVEETEEDKGVLEEAFEKTSFDEAKVAEEAGAEEAEETTEGEAVGSEENAFQQYREFTQFIQEDVHEPKDLTAESAVGTETEFASLYEGTSYQAMEVQESTPSTEEPPTEATDVEALLSEADEHVREGRYILAAETYQRILEFNPDHRMARQRLEEIKYYMKILGKDPQELVNRLEDFLGGIRKRRDEFFGSA